MSRICYNVACPTWTGTDPGRVATDQFGAHEFTNLKTHMICAPAFPGRGEPRSFQLVTPEITVPGLAAVGWCYYFRTPNVFTAAVRRLSSEMGSAVQHMFVYLTETDRMPPGTLSAAGCSNASALSSGDRLTPLYAAYTATAELSLPSDDGTNPGAATFEPPAFFSFASGELTTACTYVNDLPVRVQDGNSPAVDEQCVGLGYFFPATTGLRCVDGTVF